MRASQNDKSLWLSETKWQIMVQNQTIKLLPGFCRITISSNITGKSYFAALNGKKVLTSTLT